MSMARRPESDAYRRWLRLGESGRPEAKYLHEPVAADTNLCLLKPEKCRAVALAR
jgi:hypothetical protein